MTLPDVAPPAQQCLEADRKHVRVPMAEDSIRQTTPACCSLRIAGAYSIDSGGRGWCSGDLRAGACANGIFDIRDVLHCVKELARRLLRVNLSGLVDAFEVRRRLKMKGLHEFRRIKDVVEFVLVEHLVQFPRGGIEPSC